MANAFSKFIAILLSCLFTVSTYFGVTPYNIPAKVTLEKIEEEETVLKNEHFNFTYENGKYSLALDGVTMFADATS